MATGGWGFTSNPFAQGASGAAQPSEEAPRASQNAYGAWGGGVGTANLAAAAAAAPKPSPAQAVAAFNVATSVAAAAGNGAGGGNLAAREAELARREADLLRREAALQQISDAAKPVNFPPFCPFVYHSIAEQIPPWNRSMMRFHFFTELLVMFGFLWNTAIQLAAMFAGVIGLQWWLFSLISLTMGLPLSWWMYYKSLFRAAQTDGATYPYMRSVLLVLVNIAWCAWMVLAINGMGEFSGGIFPMIRLFQAGDSKSVAFGILYIINVVIWGLAGIGGWFSMGLGIAAYRRGVAPRQDYESRYGAGPAVA